MSPALFAWPYTESIADQTDHFADVLVRKTLHTVMTFWRRYDIRKYTADVILFKEIQCKKMDNLMFSIVFSESWAGIR